MALIFKEIDGETYVGYDGPYESWFLDTPFGCGWVGTCAGRIIAACPIFRRFCGWDLRRCPPAWKYEKLSDETEESIRRLGSDNQLTVKERLTLIGREIDARLAWQKYHGNQ
jgi:hypothetical protein